MNGHESRGTRATVTISNQLGVERRRRERRDGLSCQEMHHISQWYLIAPNRPDRAYSS